MLATSTAGAQTSEPPPEPPVTLVSNLNLGANTEPAELSDDHGQAFSTGPYLRGYVVTSMTLKLVTTPDFDPETLELSIWSTRYWEGKPRPNKELAELATPYADSEGYWVFTAPAGGIHLDRSTRYVLVLDSKKIQGNQSVAIIQSTDQSGQPQWKIYDGNIHKSANTGNTGWNNGIHSLGIEILGHEAPPSSPFWSELNRQAGGGSAVVRVGRNASSPCDGSWRPSLSKEEVLSNVAVFCNTRTREWVKGSYASPGVDYARDDQLEESSSLNGCPWGMLYDPLADECVSPSAPPR